MLTVAKVTAAGAAGYAEYLHGRAAPSQLGDYYLRDGERVEAPGRWVAGAETVGCDPQCSVDADALRELMAVRHPVAGTALRPVGASGAAVAALDATFSAPKSVSAAWAVADAELRDGIEIAHERAIDRALVYAVRTVAMVRERVDRQTVLKRTPAGLIATSWRHTTARAVADRPPDPQLHSHVLLHGAVRRDGRVVAIDSRAWLVHRRELGAAYRTELACELTRLGFAIERGTGRGGRYFEIAGIPSGLMDRWSSRHHQVQAAIEARVVDRRAVLEAAIAAGGADAPAAAQRLERLRVSGGLSAAEDRLLTTSTRSAKHGFATRADLDRYWTDASAKEGFGKEHLYELHRDQAPPVPAAERELLYRLTEFDSTFAEHDARAVALEASAGSPIDEGLAVLERASAAREVVTLADDRRTTRSHRAAERDTVNVARRLAASRADPISEWVVSREAGRLAAELNAGGRSLTGEQHDAVILACSDRRLVVIEGQAGTGKSTVLSAVARAHQAAGQQIIVTSTGALAAQRLSSELHSAGVDAATYSTASLHAAIAARHVVLGPESTIIHDEAALASTREQHQLLTAVENSGARLIEVGDPHQSRPVGAGGLWPELEGAVRATDARVELTRNVRARDPADRRDQKRFRDGHAEQALASYQDRGHLTITNEHRVAEDRALDAAHADQHAGRETIVIAQTSNEHLDELNARAQAIRLQAGQLSHGSIAVRGRTYGLHAGDQIQIRRNLTDRNLGRLANGTTGRVTSVDVATRRASVELFDGRRVTLDHDQIDRADIRLAYVQHPFPAQGHTTDTTHLIVGSQSTREGSYVGLTRAREQTHIYAETPPEAIMPGDQLAAIAERMYQTEPEIPSIHTPLAHEQTITRAQANSTPTVGTRPVGPVGPRRGLEDSDPPSYIVASLGPPPSSSGPDDHPWREVAIAIADYRRRYAIADDDPRPLGPEPSAGQFQQRYDHRIAAQQIAATQAQLDPERAAVIPDHRCLADVDRSLADQKSISRGDELAP